MTDHDPVNRPAHYRWLPGDLEVIDITEGMSFCHGNVVKYVLRADHKGSALEDLKKAQWYLAREIARREAAAPTVTEGKPADWTDVVDPGSMHNADGQYDRTVCTVCSDAFVECTGCETYFCSCGRNGACE